MTRLLRVTHVRFTPVPSELAKSGLTGWLQFVVNDALLLDGVALRRTRTGRATLSFPCRRDREGRDHPVVKPLTGASRCAIERQVLKALGFIEEAAS